MTTYYSTVSDVFCILIQLISCNNTNESNLTVQLEVGSFFEREWGTPTWFLIYTTGSMGATLLSACVHPNTISVGSSGAAVALLGAKCSEVLCKAREEIFSVQDKLGHGT